MGLRVPAQPVMVQSGPEQGRAGVFALREPLHQPREFQDCLFKIGLVLQQVCQLPQGIVRQGVIGPGGGELAIGVHGKLVVPDENPRLGDLQPGLAYSLAAGEVLDQGLQFADGQVVLVVSPVGEGCIIAGFSSVLNVLDVVVEGQHCWVVEAVVVVDQAPLEIVHRRAFHGVQLLQGLVGPEGARIVVG